MIRGGVVIDLDGVLYRGGRNGSYDLIPGASDALKQLKKAKIPFVFVTNGTNCTEHEKANTLQKLCSMPFTEQDVLLATTPMKHLVPTYENQYVLSVAWDSDRAYDLAAAQGWKKVISIQDFAVAHPTLTPAIHRSTEQNVPSWIDEKIAAIVVFTQPNNWAESIQIVCDVARSNGQIGQESPTQTVPIFAGNPDIDYAAQHSIPRFTMGAFLHCASSLYQYSTGRELDITFHGKPYPAIYQQARRVLKQATRIYAIGDNPLSDIRGANQAGDAWQSILVRTGVFQSENDNDHRYPAHFVCPSIVEAVEYILCQERKKE